MKENVPFCSFLCYMYVCMALSPSLAATLFLNYPQKNSLTNLNITPAILIPLWFSIHHFQLNFHIHDSTILGLIKATKDNILPKTMAIYYHLFSLAALHRDDYSFHPLIYPPIHTSFHPSMLKPFSPDFCDIFA